MKNSKRIGMLIPAVAVMISTWVTPAARATASPAGGNGPPRLPSCARPVWPDTFAPLPRSARVDAITIDGVRVNVLVPPNYRTNDRRYPVLYLLHGGLQWQDLYLVRSDVEAFTARRPDNEQAIVVMPDGGFGSYQDTRDATPSWERFDIGTVIPYIDGHYRTIADRAHRAITGESAGGLGTIDFAARHPDMFVAASPMSGLLDIGPTAAPPLGGAPMYHALVALTTACNDPSEDPRHTWGGPTDFDLWQHNENPTDLAPNLRGMSVRLSTGNGVACDQSDVADLDEIFPAFEPIAYVDTQHFAAALDRAGVAYQTEPANVGVHGQPCGLHSFRYFQKYLHDFWPQMIAAFGTPAPASFDYRRADSRFSVWDWTFRADPRRAGEFLDIRSAACAGLTLRGSGVETITTPPCFHPGQRVRVADGAHTATVRAGNDGRLTFGVDLGPAHTVQQFTPAEEAVEAVAGGTYWTTRHIRLTPEQPT